MRMETVYDTRRANLRLLAKQWGGPTSLARKLNHSNGSYLAQLIGPHPSRDVSEKTAREIEKTLHLASGWMDQPHEEVPVLDDAVLQIAVRAVAAALRDANLRPDPDRYATLVSLTVEHYRLTGRLDEHYITSLLKLMKG